MRIIRVIFLFAVWGFSQTVHVYLFSGQSNMQGSGQVGGLTTEEKTELTTAKIWNTDKFVNIEPGVVRLNPGNTSSFGPELFFARTMIDSNPTQEIYIIKYAASGRPLDQGWSNTTWLGPDPGPGRDNFYPGLKDGDPNVGQRYTEQMNVFKAAIKHLDDNNIDYVIKGMTWMQGEADAKHEISAKRYAQSLSFFIDRIHEDLGIAEKIPFIYGEVLPITDSLPARFLAPAEMKVSMFNAHHSSGHSDAIEKAYIVPTLGFQLNNDFVHFGTDGQRSLGEGMADSMLVALNTPVGVGAMPRIQLSKPVLRLQLGTSLSGFYQGSFFDGHGIRLDGFQARLLGSQLERGLYFIRPFSNQAATVKVFIY